MSQQPTIHVLLEEPHLAWVLTGVCLSLKGRELICEIDFRPIGLATTAEMMKEFFPVGKAVRVQIEFSDDHPSDDLDSSATILALQYAHQMCQLTFELS